MGRALLTAVIIFSLASNSLAVMAGKIIEYEVKGAGKVVFDGTTHANKGLTCVDCHPSPFQMKKGSTEMKMELMDKHKGCGSCHDGKRAFKAEDPGNCEKCHQRAK